MNDLQIFTYQQSAVRTIERDGEPWFVLKDVAGILSIDNHKDLMKRLDPDEVGRFELPHPQNPDKTIEMICTNESGLYSVILRSDKPEAKPFRKWVTSEVIPAIRRHGSYSRKPLTPAEQLLAQANVLVEQERRLSALEETAEKTSRAIEMIAAPAASMRDTGQEETGKAIRQMCAEYALNYHSTTGDLYKELEGRAGIDLDARKRNLQKRLRANGATATECKAVSKLSVIARNPQLREIFTGIVQRKAAGLLTNRLTPA